ncbi:MULTISPECIES: KpsF/GutQ family sugar-phosphate isomerase [unclassified Paludibacterium]|uniref:KpsF/GutQ family sugar-phosphate isomerase n=1 Tax=unclassified Paludibacterium TaxID=2618429 RepID=UPI001C05B85A|nr:KpsF/GutQ family sugar-phosphate isomerase [Paludibacterium sp. B53371]BEV73595.1 KpsF/GutQ family sugar-phosphate isomerase [Paludibacterium sp. THUN1379]
MDTQIYTNRLQSAREVLRTEAEALEALALRLNGDFSRAVDLILACKGRLVVTGMGKSGHVARKIAATMASTGTPAFFLHPAEAVHGDLGMIMREDVLLALSNSGESDEVLAMWPALKRKGIHTICMTGREGSTMAKLANVHLDAHVDKEACPLGLAPTSSTTAQLALGDALAVTLMQERQFREEDFAMSHPAGSLGRRLLVRVADVMHTGEALPCVKVGASLKDALLEMSKKGLGMTAVADAAGSLVGVYTDGDLRRTLDKTLDLTGIRIEDVMTRSPRTIAAHCLATEAVEQMEASKVLCLLVTNAEQQLVGALNMHDLFKAGVV